MSKLEHSSFSYVLGSDHSDGIGKLKPKKSMSWASTIPLESQEYYLMKPVNIKDIRPLADNYCGLPLHAIEFSASALIYQSRKKAQHDSPTEIPEEDTQVRKEIHHDKTNDNEEVKSIKNSSSQRKVAQAMLTMATKEKMAPHFIYRGGLAAIFKLISECDDIHVLTTCANAILISSNNSLYCKVLIEKDVLSNISTLMELKNQHIYLLCAKILANLSSEPGCEYALILGGIVSIIQLLYSNSGSLATLSCSLICINNIAPFLFNTDAEVAIRLFFQSPLKLIISTNIVTATLLIDVCCNLSLIDHFTSFLVEDGVLPLIIHLMDTYPTAAILNQCIKCFLNFSLNRKKRRDIAVSGIGNQLEKIFNIDKKEIAIDGDVNSDPRIKVMLMIGNLLHSGYFHDKISKESIIIIMLDLLEPETPLLFTSVSFCLSQLAVINSAADILVNCDIIPIVLRVLPKAPADAIECLYGLLVNLSSNSKFLDIMYTQTDVLIPNLFLEVNKGVIDITGKLAYNLATRPDFHSYLSLDKIEVFVDTLKLLCKLSNGDVKTTALQTLVNFSYFCKKSRNIIFSDDLFEFLENCGLSSVQDNICYLSLINIISNEANCCISMLQKGAHKFLVTLFSIMKPKTSNSVIINSLGPKVRSIKKLANGVVDIIKNDNSYNSELPTLLVSQETSDLAMSIISSTYHNLSLKRPILGPGVLLSILTLMRNCKSIRTLHCVRCLANVTTMMKPKVQITKEKQIIPMLTAIMRFGCEQAELVQHYCALAICNILAAKIDNVILEDLSKCGSIVDLVVVTRLRVNSILIKETLAKSLYNLLAKPDFRPEMVNQFDILAALVELAKLDSLELLELAAKSIFNISCQTFAYSDSLLSIKIPHFLVQKSYASPNAQGSRPDKAVKLLLAQSIANISFEPKLAHDLLAEDISAACSHIFLMDDEVSVYCVSLTLFNLSKIDNVSEIADTNVIPLLVKIISENRFIISTELAVATLCNFSFEECFFLQLDEVAIGPLTSLMDEVITPILIKIDILKIFYNLVTRYEATRTTCIVEGSMKTIYKFLKSQEDKDILCTIGRVVKEICSVTTDVILQKKIIYDGVMDVLLKLSKKEIPSLKIDVASALFSLTWGTEMMLVLKYDTIDVLFWLTLYDCQSLMDRVRQNVSRIIRNFSCSKPEMLKFVNEERFITIIMVLIKTHNEDILWQTSGILFNMLSIVECQEILIKKGIVPIIFEIAASGYNSVRRVCSSCLHLVSDSIPDMEDPAVLELLLCLLNDDGDNGESFSDLGEKSYTPLQQTEIAVPTYSIFESTKTDFISDWLTITCPVDTEFSPSLIITPSENSCSIEVYSFSAAENISDPQKLNYNAKYELNEAHITENDDTEISAILSPFETSKSNKDMTSPPLPPISPINKKLNFNYTNSPAKIITFADAAKKNSILNQSAPRLPQDTLSAILNSTSPTKELSISSPYSSPKKSSVGGYSPNGKKKSPVRLESLTNTVTMNKHGNRTI